MVDRLTRFVGQSRRLFVLTGAGVSTACGIPDYRDADGQWKRRRPVQLADFIRKETVRRRYWARSLLGWPSFSGARPGGAHRALARLERQGRVHQLVTQNVDRLHQRAGSTRVIDLHGRLDRVECLDCRAVVPRRRLQGLMERRNPAYRGLDASLAPDGDADLHGADVDRFDVPVCEDCGGTLKPSVVFFGESVPRSRVEQAFRALEESDGVLVAGSSLMVWSGFRFCRAAAAAGKPIAAVNLGRTRADDLFALKVRGDCSAVLAELADQLAPGNA